MRLTWVQCWLLLPLLGWFTRQLVKVKGLSSTQEKLPSLRKSVSPIQAPEAPVRANTASCSAWAETVARLAPRVTQPRMAWR